MADTCDQMDERRWAHERFAARCYFYPDRDCIGWQPGQQCGRIGDMIPDDQPDA